MTLSDVLSRTAEGHPLIDENVVAYFGRFSDDDPRSVIDNEPSSDSSTGMNLYSRFSYRPLSNKTGEEKHFMPIEKMRPTVHTDGLNTGI